MKQFGREGIARLATLVTVAIPASVQAVKGAGHIDFGSIELTPVLKTRFAYDDNIYRDKSNRSSSFFFTINPSLELKALSGVNEYSLQLNALKKDYLSEPYINYNDIFITGKIKQEFTRRHRLDVNMTTGRLHTANVKGFNDLPPQYEIVATDFVYGFGVEEAIAGIDVFGAIEKKDYRYEDKDMSAKGIGSTFYYRLMPQTRALIEVDKRNLIYENIDDTRFDISSYMMGLSWTATAKTSGYAKFGRRYRSTGVSGIGTDGYNAWEVGISYQLLPYSYLHLTTIRDYSLDQDPEAFNFNSSKNTKLIWSHTWSHRASTAISWTNGSTDIQDKSGRILKTRVADTVSLSLSWKIKRWLTLSTSYTFEKRDDELIVFNSTEEDGDYKRNIYSMTVIMTL